MSVSVPLVGYGAKAESVLGSISYTKIYETLLESMGVIRRILWNDHKLFNDIACVYPMDEDNVFVTDYYFYYVALLNLRTGFKWKLDMYSGYTLRNGIGLDYDPDNNRLYVGCRDGVLVLDSRTGSIIKRITKLGANDLTNAYVWGIRLDRETNEDLYFTLEGKHVLVKYNLSTDSYSIFGTFGTRKSDFTGLSGPMDVEVREDPGANEVYVADRENDRILVLDKDLNVLRAVYLHNVGFVHRQRWGDKYTNLYAIASSPRPGAMSYIMLADVYGLFLGRPSVFLPWQGDLPRFTPDLNYMWVGQAYAIEINILAAKNMIARGFPRLNPFTYLLMNRQSVTTSGATSRVITPLFFTKVLLEVISDQAGTAYIEVPEGATAAGFGYEYATDHTWVEYDSFSFSAGKSTPYVFAQPPPVFRVRVVPSANATISLRVTIAW